MKKPTKTTASKIRRLDHPANQRLMLHYISLYGKEDGCWEGICCDRTYKTWKKQHEAEWDEQIKTAQAQFYNAAKLNNPILHRKLIQNFQRRIFDDKLSVSEMLQAFKFLEDHQQRG